VLPDVSQIARPILPINRALEALKPIRKFQEVRVVELKQMPYDFSAIISFHSRYCVGDLYG
jgi:hypothetical protein